MSTFKPPQSGSLQTWVRVSVTHLNRTVLHSNVLSHSLQLLGGVVVLLRDLDLALGLGDLVDDLLELTRVQDRLLHGNGLHQLGLLEQLGGFGVGDLHDLVLGDLVQDSLLLLSGQPGPPLQQGAIRLHVDDGGGGQVGELRAHHGALLHRADAR